MNIVSSTVRYQEVLPMNSRAIVASFMVFLCAAPATGQVYAPGPSLPILFDNVLDVPSPPPVGVSVSGGVGGVAGQTTQLNINTNGSATNNFTAASGAEVNIDGGMVGNNFTALGGSEVNLLSGDIGLDFRAESNRVDISGGTVDRRLHCRYFRRGEHLRWKRRRRLPSARRQRD